MDAVTIIAATLGVAWASGINLYAAVFVLGWLGMTGSVDLPPGLEVVQSPLVMIAAAFMYCVEFVTDKVPGVDTGWDALHTFIRIPIGALLAAGMISPLGAEAELLGLLLGGSLAAGTHATKSGCRVMINTSPEPVSNWTASITEDVLAIAGLWMALNHPVLFLVLLLLFIALMIWLLPKIWRGIRAVARKIAGFFGARRDAGPPPAPPEAPGQPPAPPPGEPPRRRPRNPPG